MLVITDETSRADIAEAIRYVNEYAHRQPHVLGVTAPSRWDAAHSKLDALLEDWLNAAPDANA